MLKKKYTIPVNMDQNMIRYCVFLFALYWNDISVRNVTAGWLNGCEVQVLQ